MKGAYVTRTYPEIHSRHSCAPVQKSRGIRESLRESIQLFSSKEGSYEHQCNYRYYHDSVLLRHGMVLCEGIQPDGGICNHGNVLDCPALVGNAFSPTSAMEGKTFIQVLEYVYAEGPAGYAKSILVNVFFGAFFGRVLVDTGIAATLIRKVVELGGDKPESPWRSCVLLRPLSLCP